MPLVLPAGFNGANSSKNSSQPRIEEFFNDPMLTRLIDQGLAGNRELKILAQDVKDDADEPLSELFERKTCEARGCEGAYLQHAAGSAGLWNPQFPPAGVRLNLPAGFKKATSSGPDLPADANEATCSENSAQLGIEEFYNDPLLTGLIQQALADNRELKILNEEVQIARNEILSRQGAYLPFVTVGASGGLNKYSDYTLPGASLNDDPFLPGKFLPNPLPDTMLGLNLFWQLDIWRQLRNARDAAAQRYVAASERRNYFVTRLVAEIAENYYRLMALDKRLETLDSIIAIQEQSLKVAEVKKAAARGTELPVQRFLAEVRRTRAKS